MNVDFVGVVGGNIKRLRQNRRMTQDELAAKMKTTKSYISAVENGHRDIRLSSVRSFCSALRVAPGTLFRFREEDVKDGSKAAS